MNGMEKQRKVSESINLFLSGCLWFDEVNEKTKRKELIDERSRRERSGQRNGPAKQINEWNGEWNELICGAIAESQLQANFIQSK